MGEAKFNGTGNICAADKTVAVCTSGRELRDSVRPAAPYLSASVQRSGYILQPGMEVGSADHEKDGPTIPSNRWAAGPMSGCEFPNRSQSEISKVPTC